MHMVLEKGREKAFTLSKNSKPSIIEKSSIDTTDRSTKPSYSPIVVQTPFSKPWISLASELTAFIDPPSFFILSPNLLASSLNTKLQRLTL